MFLSQKYDVHCGCGIFFGWSSNVEKQPRQRPYSWAGASDETFGWVGLLLTYAHTHIYPYRHSQCLMYPKIGYGIFPKQMIVDWRVKNQFRIMNYYTPIWSCHPLRIRARRAELEARAPPVPTPSRSGRTIYVLSINTKIGVFSFLHIKNPINYIMRSMSSISQSR